MISTVDAVNCACCQTSCPVATSFDSFLTSYSCGSFPEREEPSDFGSARLRSAALGSARWNRCFRSAEERGRDRASGRAGDGSTHCPVKGGSVPRPAAHRGRENKRRCAHASDTKPGHAETMRPAQWVANKWGALLILHQLFLIFRAHLNLSLEFVVHQKNAKPVATLNPLHAQTGFCVLNI